MEPLFRCVFHLMVFSLVSATCSRNNGSTDSIDIDLAKLSIDEIIGQIKIRGVCCIDLTRYFLDRIKAYNPILQAVITVDEEGALRDAQILDSHYNKNGKLKGNLHCAPTLIKDNIFVKGLPTTLGIRLFSNATAEYDAPIVTRLRREGAIILGKANMVMFAAGSTDVGSETGGLAKNPYALNYTVVGSSTGNAVAVAARLAVIGIGSDSGGSITAPASATSTVGVRPPSGFSDMRDIFPLLGQPFDVIGPMTLNARDAITVMKVLQTSGNRDSMKFNGRNIRIGILRSLTYDTANISLPALDATGSFTTNTYSVDEEVQECFRTFQRRLDVLSEKYNIISKVVTDNVVQLARPVLQHEQYRWSCVIPHMNRFLNQRPMRSLTGEMIDNATDIAAHNSTPFYYTMLFEYLDKRSSSCQSSKELYDHHLTTVRRRLRHRIFDRGIDIVAMPTLNAMLWPLLEHRPQPNSSSDVDDAPSPHSNGHLHDLGGLFALPAMNLPLCFSKPRPGAPQGLPIGGYLMTMPERVGTMLEFARIYEQVFRDPKLPQVLPEDHVGR